MILKKILSLSEPKISSLKILSSLFILLSLSIFINFNARVHEKEVWEQNPSIFTAEGQPLIRSGDPAYFLNIALYLKRNISLLEYNQKLYYPNIINEKNTKPPPLSVLISYLAEGPSISDIVEAGNKLVIISSVLTTVGIFFLFFAIGRPFEGIIASTGAGISSIYYVRSSIGTIDTDILNLFFMYFLFGLVYLASREQTWVKNILFTIFAGLTGKIFFIWYPKPELILMSFMSLLFFTTFNTKDWKKILINSVIYISLTNPTLYLNSLNILISNPYLSGYLSANVESIDLVNTTALNFNSVFEFIGETQKPPLIDLFKVENSIFLGLICFIGLVLWGISNPVMFIGFAPLSLFFLLSLLLGNRAIFYSLPFIWFGFGYFINFITFKIISYKSYIVNKNLIYIILSLFLLVFTIIATDSYPKKTDKPIFHPSLYKALIKMADIVVDKNKSVLVSSWSFGYQSLFYNDIPVLIHPGIPASPRHYFIARAFHSFDLEETSKILNYIANGNVEKINEKKLDNFVSLSKDLYNAEKSDDDIYLLLSGQQRLWFNSLGSIAYWDIENNRPQYFDGKTAYEILHLLEINCDDLDTTTLTTKCSDREGSQEKNIDVNLATGTWDGESKLKRVVQITDGKVEINQEYQGSQGNLVFQIVKNTEDNTSNLYLMHEAVFRSAYNKLFHLNESGKFELVYDDYPNIKVYKIN